jgi:hypothetical protein
MLKRVFSSSTTTINLYKKNCIDCRLYNKKTKICKINKLNAIDNRINENICGIDGKKFWALDKTYLIKSIQAENFSGNLSLFTLASLPCAIFYDWHILSISFMSFMASCVSSANSSEYERKYLDDNDII